MLAVDGTIADYNDNTHSQEAIALKIVASLITDTYSEPVGVPAATASLKDKIGWLTLLARNKITQTSDTQTVYDDAGSGSVAASTVSDSGGTTTRGEYS